MPHKIIGGNEENLGISRAPEISPSLFPGQKSQGPARPWNDPESAFGGQSPLSGPVGMFGRFQPDPSGRLPLTDLVPRPSPGPERPPPPNPPRAPRICLKLEGGRGDFARASEPSGKEIFNWGWGETSGFHYEKVKPCVQGRCPRHWDPPGGV